MLTAVEHSGKAADELIITYVGDGRNNVSNALLIGAAQLGYEYRVATPKELFPSDAMLEFAHSRRAQFWVTADPYEAVQGTDVIYTDVWFSMGEEEQAEERIALLRDYQVTEELLAASGNPQVLFEHCLPAFHDLKTEMMSELGPKFGLTALEVSDAVFRGPHSVVFDQAENRMHTIKAILVATLTGITG